MYSEKRRVTQVRLVYYRLSRDLVANIVVSNIIRVPFIRYSGFVAKKVEPLLDGYGEFA